MITFKEVIGVLLVAGSVGGLAYIYQKHIKEYEVPDKYKNLVFDDE